MGYDDSLRARALSARDAAVPRPATEERNRLAAVGGARGAPGSTRAIRVLLIEDARVSHPGMRPLLRGAPDIEIVGETVDWVEGLAIAERVRPDVVLLDADLARVDTVAAVRYLVGSPVPTRVLLVTTHMEDARLRTLLAAGASGMLMRGTPARQAVETVRALITPVETTAATNSARVSAMQAEQDRKLAIFKQLSEREQAVFRLTAEGFNGSEIGRTLGISPKTVDTYRSRIEEKLGTRHRVDYVRFALDIELLHR
jgi:DNA-binding NarL/FixJ family response regulator